MHLTSPFPSRKAALAAVLLALLGAGLALYLWPNHPESDPGRPTDPWGIGDVGKGGHTARRGGAAGFREAAQESGITFRMNFLPGEQGENFKINLYDHGCGLAVGDYDGDGHDDIFFCNQLGKCALYRNKGDGTFEDVTQKAGVGLGDRVCVAATFADYDNDGHQDLFVTSTRGGNVLFHNNGNGTFTNVTREAKVEYVGHSQTAVFFDYDNDGWLDLFVANTAKWTTDDFDPRGRYYRGEDLKLKNPTLMEDNLLYHNNRDGTFTEVTRQAGLQGKGWSSDVAVVDFDEDGWPDLLVTRMFGPCQLFRNKGDGTYTDLTRAVLGRTPFGAVGTKVIDIANDGLLSLFIVDMHSDMWMNADVTHWSQRFLREWATKKPKYLRGPPAQEAANVREEEDFVRVFRADPADVFFGNALYRNRGRGKFEEVSDKAGMETFWPWGIATGDFDNDGHEDAFITAGMGYPFYYWPNSLMMNNGDGTFTDRAADLGIEPPARGINLPETIHGQGCVRSSRCCASADFDGDGRVDVMVNNFNDLPYYFRNELPRRNYIAFRLRGTRSNRDAVGAIVRLYTGKEVMTRQVNPAGGYLSQSSRTLHFGLGDRTKVDRLEIIWPRSPRQTIDNPEINKLHQLTEPPQ